MATSCSQVCLFLTVTPPKPRPGFSQPHSRDAGTRISEVCVLRVWAISSLWAQMHRKPRYNHISSSIHIFPFDLIDMFDKFYVQCPSWHYWSRSGQTQSEHWVCRSYNFLVIFVCFWYFVFFPLFIIFFSKLWIFAGCYIWGGGQLKHLAPHPQPIPISGLAKTSSVPSAGNEISPGLCKTVSLDAQTIL